MSFYAAKRSGPRVTASAALMQSHAALALGPADDLGRGPVVFAQKWWGKGFEAAAPEQGSRPARALTH